MRVMIAMLAAAALLLGACSKCGPRDVPAVVEADVAPAPVAPTKPDVEAAKPKADTVQAAKIDMRPVPIRKAPNKNLKVAPVRKCAKGGCELRCGLLERCLLTCDGGNCHQLCGPESSCSATCIGGGCVQQCQSSAGCTFRCSGGQCDQQCDAKAACSRTCTGGDCKVCQGADCKVEPL
jgi:hypothetical protein